jgi:hypothetical protein
MDLINCHGVSFLLQLTGKKYASLFLGQWAAPFLIPGLYNEIIKVHGHDGTWQ